MIIKTVTGAAAFAALLAQPVFADGSPMSEPVPGSAPPPPAETGPVHEPAPAPASADGFYASLAGGVAWLSDFELEVEDPAILDSIFLESDSGWTAIGALGYDLGNGMRAELEVGYRNNDGLAVVFPLGLTEDSTVGALDIMVNALYGFETSTPLRPYAGVGIGTVRAEVEFVDSGSLHEAADWAFAYQVIGGMNYPLPNTSVVLFADYRYLASAGLELDLAPVYSHDSEYRSHTVLGGVRVAF